VRALYDAWYRWGTPPWVGAARDELVGLVGAGRIRPGRAIDLGCGVGDNAVFLARHGFDVTGVDFAPSAVRRARAKAREAGVPAVFRVADLTRLDRDLGTFDLLVDYGTLDDLGPAERDAYVARVVPLARPGGQFLLWCFEWNLSRRERLLTALLPFGSGMAMAPGEVEARFGSMFDIERVAGATGLRGWPSGWAAYLMRRRAEPVSSPSMIG
jgi:SAM-dependent methyltransferase